MGPFSPMDGKLSRSWEPKLLVGLNGLMLLPPKPVG